MASIRAGLVHWFMRAIHVDARYATVQAARETMRRHAARDGQPLRVPLLASTVSESAAGGHPVYWLKSNQGIAQSAILYLHGGAFVHPPSVFHWRYADKIARATGLPLALAVYPKAPVHQYGEAYDFLTRVYLDMRAAGYADITVMGDSAGATLTLGLCMWLAAQGLPPPNRLIPISPCVDLAMTNPEIPQAKAHDPMLATEGLHEIVRAWSGGADLRDCRLSPLYGDIAALPPTLLIIGEYEILRPDARLFAARAGQAGAPLAYREYAEMLHVFPMMPIAEAKAANREIIDFIKGET